MIKKLSPRRVILIAVAFLLLAGVCYMLWPHRFADLQPECDSVTLICMVDTPRRTYSSLRRRSIRRPILPIPRSLRRPWTFSPAIPTTVPSGL